VADLDADRVRGVGGGELIVPAAGAGRSAMVVNVKVTFAAIGVRGERYPGASHRRGFNHLDRSPLHGSDRHVVEDERSGGGEKLFLGQNGSRCRWGGVDPGEEGGRPGHGPGETAQRLVHPSSLVHASRAESDGRLCRSDVGRNAPAA